MIRKCRLSINKVRSPMWKADHFTSTEYCIRTEQSPSEDRKLTLDNSYYEELTNASLQEMSVHTESYKRTVTGVKPCMEQ